MTANLSPARLQQVRQLLVESGFGSAELEPLAGDASFRRYIRVRDGGRTAMLMDAPPEKEDVGPYLKIARYLHAKGYSAPEILAEDAPKGLLLLEDLGDDSFTALLKRRHDAAVEREFYEAAVDLLSEWHTRPGWVTPQALPLPLYDHALLLKEAALFCDWYLPQVLGKDEATARREEYLGLWKDILRDTPLATDGWVHRDYHADNLMWRPERKNVARVGLLDFQDGVYGDAAYDLVSLLEDARRDVPPDLAAAMIERYLNATGVDREHFLAAYAVLAAQRNSKIVGIFVRLAARDGKYAYLHFLPRVWGYLEKDLAHPTLSRLRDWIDAHVAPPSRGEVKVRHDWRDLALSA